MLRAALQLRPRLARAQPRRRGLQNSFWGGFQAPFPPPVTPQAALKCSYRSDRLTRDGPVALRAGAAQSRTRKVFWTGRAGAGASRGRAAALASAQPLAGRACRAAKSRLFLCVLLCVFCVVFVCCFVLFCVGPGVFALFRTQSRAAAQP